jgi:tryptophan-rich sensory protein
MVGLFLFSLVHFFTFSLSRLLIDCSVLKPLSEQMFGSFLPIGFTPVWVLVYTLNSLGIWSLWRRFSLKVLALEVSLFLAGFLLHWVWYYLFFIQKEPFLALLDLLLVSCSVFLTILVFWKKEKEAALFFVPYLTWTLYIGSLNMLLCMSS